MSSKLKFFQDLYDDLGEQISYNIIVSTVKGAKKDIIIQVFSHDPGTKKIVPPIDRRETWRKSRRSVH